MKDLTHGPISRLLVAMAVPTAIGMLQQLWRRTTPLSAT
jgi:hypothetical protein